MRSILKWLLTGWLAISCQIISAYADYHPGVVAEMGVALDQIERIELYVPLQSRPIVSLRPSELKGKKREKFGAAPFVFFTYDKLSRGLSGRAKIFVNRDGRKEVSKGNFVVIAGGEIRIEGRVGQTAIAKAAPNPRIESVSTPSTNAPSEVVNGGAEADTTTTSPAKDRPAPIQTAEKGSEPLMAFSERAQEEKEREGPRFGFLAGGAYINKEMTSARIGRFVRPDGEELDIVASDPEIHTVGPIVGATADFGLTEVSGRFYWGKGSFSDQGQVKPGAEMARLDFLGLSPGGAQGQSLGTMGVDAGTQSKFKYRRAIVALDRDLDFVLREMPSLTAVAGLQAAYGTFRHSWLSSLTTPGDPGIRQDRTGEQKNREIGAGFNLTLIADPRRREVNSVRLYATVTFEALHKDAEVNIDEMNICAICGPLDQNFANQVRIHDTFWTWGVGIRGGAAWQVTDRLSLGFDMELRRIDKEPFFIRGAVAPNAQQSLKVRPRTAVDDFFVFVGAKWDFLSLDD